MKKTIAFARAAADAMQELLETMPEHEKSAMAHAVAVGGALMSLGMTVGVNDQSLVHLDLIDIEGKPHRVLSVSADPSNVARKE